MLPDASPQFGPGEPVKIAGRWRCLPCRRPQSPAAPRSPVLAFAVRPRHSSCPSSPTSVVRPVARWETVYPRTCTNYPWRGCVIGAGLEVGTGRVVAAAIVRQTTPPCGSHGTLGPLLDSRCTCSLASRPRTVPGGCLCGGGGAPAASCECEGCCCCEDDALHARPFPGILGVGDPSADLRAHAGMFVSTNGRDARRSHRSGSSQCRRSCSPVRCRRYWCC